MTKDRDDEAAIQIDGYRIKVKATPSGEREPPPATWREVGRRVNQHLKTIVAGVPGLVADLVVGASSLIRGIARLPSALAHRVEGAHDRADAAEGRAQGSGAPALPADEAVRQLEAVLKRIQVQGLTAEIVIREDGTRVVVAGRPELKELAGDLAAESQALLPAGGRADE